MASENESLFQRWRRDAIIAGTAGVVVAIGIGVVTILLGQFSGAEARRLVEATIPTSRIYCSTLMTVTATILALMLTMVGLGNSSDKQLSDAHYHRIVKLAFYDSLLFGMAAILLLIQCIPVYESDKIPPWWYSSIYYALLGITSALAGGAVAVISLLYFAVKDVIQVIGLNMEDHPLRSDCSEPAVNRDDSK